MNKPELKDLKPGMIFIGSRKYILRDFGQPELFVYIIKTAPTMNTSFTVSVFNVVQSDIYTNYWKSKEWDTVNLKVPNSNDQKKIIRSIFMILYK